MYYFRKGVRDGQRILTMKITKNQIIFPAKTITIKTDGEHIYQIDYIISMLVDRILSSMRGMNRKELWEEDLEHLYVDITLEDGTKTHIAIYNTEHHVVHIFIGEELVEEIDELLLATQFLENIKNDLNELYSAYKCNKEYFATMKADTRDDLNSLELAIELYER